MFVDSETNRRSTHEEFVTVDVKPDRAQYQPREGHADRHDEE